MTRRKPGLQILDLNAWPRVAYTTFDANARETFKQRMKAVQRYADGDAIRVIEQTTGVNRRQLYRWLERGNAPHSDGRLVGFRALLPYQRVSDYVRLSPVKIAGERGSRGTVGAMSQLFEQQPVLSGWLLQQIKQRRIQLAQINTEGRLRTRLRGLQALHGNFLHQCRILGLTMADYPFSTASRGIRSLSAYVKAELLRSVGRAAQAAGATHLKGLPRPDEARRGPAANRPYQVVEFDGHRLDIRLKIVVQDPLGFQHEFEIERIWLLAIIDVCTRAILGYHLALAREYSRYDVIKTVENALEPHRARTFTIPGLEYGPQDGFPSQRLPELAYATWEWIKLDNAKANLANETLQALCEFIGCSADAGPKHSPDERPYIERFFGTVASRFSARLPGYTGSHPRDLRRALSSPNGNLRLYLSLDELEDLIEYAISTYHGTPHAGLNHVTPLEAMEYFIRGKQMLLTWLPDPVRRTLCLMQTARQCPVRAYLGQGVRPHINLHGVRYSNPVLATSTHLVGRRLQIYMNSEDLRGVRAFLPDGTELGVLTAQGAWGIVPHNLKLRQEIRKSRDAKQSPLPLLSEAIEAHIQRKFAQAKKTRKAATELGRTLRTLADAPIPRLPAGPHVPTVSDSAAILASSSISPNPVIDTSNPTPRQATLPKKLTIGSGQTY